MRLPRLARLPRRTILSGVCVTAAVTVAVAVVLFLPIGLINARHVGLAPKDRMDAESAVRSALIQLLGGSAIITGLYFSAREFRLSRESHITDRYARAVEQLGHESLDVRLGATYALERILRNSPDDRAAVIEVLSAYVREHTRKGSRTPSVETAPADVQAAMTVLGRLKLPPERRLDFYHCGLRGLSLQGTNFSHAMFYYSYLEDVVFATATLEGTGLSFCHAERAAFGRSNARGADFVNAVYRNCWFMAADLTDADFYGTDLGGSDFGRRYAEEGDPPIEPAIMTNVRMTNARLKNTILKGVDLSTVRGLTAEQLAEAVTDDRTIMPIRWRTAEDDR